MRDGSPAFVTVMARTDEPGGWRKGRNDSGAVLDVASGEAVTTGLAMPHSPRWHDGNLFVLNSGMGRLERVDLATGHREADRGRPGLRAWTGAPSRSRLRGPVQDPRDSHLRRRTDRGLPRPAQVWRRSRSSSVPATRSRRLQFANGVEEIFDVQTVPGARCPTFGGSPGDEDEVWLLPGQPESALAER